MGYVDAVSWYKRVGRAIIINLIIRSDNVTAAGLALYNVTRAAAGSTLWTFAYRGNTNRIYYVHIIANKMCI